MAISKNLSTLREKLIQKALEQVSAFFAHLPLDRTGNAWV